MQTSEAIAELAADLAAASVDLADPTKAQQGQVRGRRDYRYAGLDDVVRVVRPQLAKNGLSILQGIDDDRLITMLLHRSGQWVRTYYPLTRSGDPQEQGSALTYARRYSVLALLDLAPVEDDDGASASRAAAPQPTPQPTPQPRWSKGEQGAFFAELSAAGVLRRKDGEPGYTYDEIAAFATSLGRLRPSAMTGDQRRKLVAYLRSEDGGEHIAKWLDSRLAEAAS